MLFFARKAAHLCADALRRQNFSRLQRKPDHLRESNNRHVRACRRNDEVFTGKMENGVKHTRVWSARGRGGEEEEGATTTHKAVLSNQLQRRNKLSTGRGYSASSRGTTWLPCRWKNDTVWLLLLLYTHRTAPPSINPRALGFRRDERPAIE